MSYLTLNFFASTLNFRTEVKVVLPEYPAQRISSVDRQTAYDKSLTFPVVYLLHGFTGDHSDWFSMVPIERYAQEYGFAVVMPHGYNSWYLNEPRGAHVEDFLFDELPAAMEAMLPVSAKCLLSDTPLPEDEALLEHLLLSREDQRLIKKCNMFVIEQML